MQRETNKPRVRLVRNSDGSLRPSGSVSKDSGGDGLKSAWAAQESFLANSNTTLKQEIKKAKKWAGIKAVGYKNKINTNSTKNKSNNANTSNNQSKISVNYLKTYITRRNSIVALFLVLVLAGGISLIIANSNDKPNGQSEVAGEIEKVEIVTGVTPSFPVMSIDGSGEVPGGYARINPPGSPDVYAFLDNLQNVPIKVSQQKAPDGVLADAGKMKEVAEQFGATESFEAGEITVYLGKSINGPQSLLYNKGNLLVLMVADSPIPNDEWIEYIGNLQF